jgi:DNA-directed RNA polymerase subunit alpha
MRVGDPTDFNRLRIAIETDGTLTARKALESAIEIMITQLKAVVGFREEEIASASAEMNAPSAPVVDSTEAMKTRIEDLELSSRTVSALEKANIRTVGGLARKKEQDLVEIEGLGPKAIQEIKRALANYGIVLK